MIVSLLFTKILFICYEREDWSKKTAFLLKTFKKGEKDREKKKWKNDFSNGLIIIENGFK